MADTTQYGMSSGVAKEMCELLFFLSKFQGKKRSHCEWMHCTCFVFQYDYASFINIEHVVNNVPAVHMQWV